MEDHVERVSPAEAGLPHEGVQVRFELASAGSTLSLVSLLGRSPAALDILSVGPSGRIYKVATVVDSKVSIPLGLDPSVGSPFVGDDRGPWSDLLENDRHQRGSVSLRDGNDEALASLSADPAEHPLLRENATCVVLALREQCLIDLDRCAGSANGSLVLADAPGSNFTQQAVPVHGCIMADPKLLLAVLDGRLLLGPAVDEENNLKSNR